MGKTKWGKIFGEVSFDQMHVINVKVRRNEDKNKGIKALKEWV